MSIGNSQTRHMKINKITRKCSKCKGKPVKFLKCRTAIPCTKCQGVGYFILERRKK